MSTTVFLAVILAAILHASWNALVKSGADKTLSIAGVVFGHLPFAIGLLLFVPAPDPASYPYLFVGILLHFGYQLFLLMSYRLGDLTQVYPLARGSAPLIVAAISVLILGVDLSGTELVAIAVIGCGILSLSLVRHHDGLRNAPAALMALGTGGFIAGYSLVDGLGAREAGTALGFYCWLAIGNAVTMAAFVVVKDPGLFRKLPTAGLSTMVLGGSASFWAYALVMWAFTKSPIALVTALRETSIIVALLIGVFHLKEKLSLAKLLSAMTTMVGVIMLRYSR